MSAAEQLLILAICTLILYCWVNRRYPASHWPSMIAALAVLLTFVGGFSTMVEGVR